jgi:branched-subunit amino acid ABC-type transport system permease component
MSPARRSKSNVFSMALTAGRNERGASATQTDRSLHPWLLGNGFSGIVPWLAMMLVLLVKPYGLFGTEEIRRV